MGREEEKEEGEEEGVEDEEVGGEEEIQIGVLNRNLNSKICYERLIQSMRCL